MTDEPGLRIQLDPEAPRLPGFVRVNQRDDADVPLVPADGLPFTDRSVAVIEGGTLFESFDLPGALSLLLECRRVLQPGGILRLCCPRRAAAPSSADVPAGDINASARPPDLRHLAAQVGFGAASPADGPGPEPAEPMAALPGGASPAIEFTKPDRRVTGNPLVSILIPAYNPRFFDACLDSALAQTYANIEIVVCDDSEGTEIEAIARRGMARRALRYERNPGRLHGRANYIKCFAAARGEFVKFLNDDDLLMPACVQTLLDAFRREPDLALATSRRQRIDAAGNPLPDQPATLPIVGADSVIAGFTLANAMLMAGLNIVGEPSTTLFRKADLMAQKPDYFCFDGAYGWGVLDMATWSTLLLMGNAVYLRSCQSSFRIHPAQRQQDPGIRERTVTGIRNLQAAWLRLGLYARKPPDHLLVKPFPSAEDRGWQLQRVLSFAAPPPRPAANAWDPAWSGPYTLR